MRRPSIHPSALAVACLLASLACASGNAPPPDSSINTRELNSPGSHVIETTDVNSLDYQPVKGSPMQALTTLSQVYADLQIPIGTMVPDAGEIGNTNLRLATHRLHGHLISEYLDCGSESMVGSRADLDEVTLNVLTTVKRNRDSVTVFATQVSGIARPSGTSSAPVDCQSTGELEKTIAKQLLAALGSPEAPKAD